MAIERKGAFTPKQEKFIDEVIVLKGAAEMLDGPAIQLADNVGLEAAKNALLKKYPNITESDIDGYVDLIFQAFGCSPE